MSERPSSRSRVRVTRFEDDRTRERTDHVAAEEPLEIRVVAAGGEARTVAVTMRTPGADFELTAGFLFGEGILRDRADLREIRYCTDEAQQYNVVSVELAAAELPDLGALERHSFTSSACGVCGKAGLETLAAAGYEPLPPGASLSPETLLDLPRRLREAQAVFDSTGGLHAAGLFTVDGEAFGVREDVGRHNAVDKVVGLALLDGRLPLADHVLCVSGRTSYEIVQKALTAGIPIVCAVSAPSSLAVEVATNFGMTLVGFLREGRFNVYAGAERVRVPTPVGDQ